eukprot:g297.t1
MPLVSSCTPEAVNELVEYTEVDAAVKIQSLFRGHASRKQKVEKMTAAFKHRFILKMQRLYRKRALRKSGLVGITRNREMDENRDREIAYRLGKRVEAKDVRLRSGFAGFGSEYSSSTPSAEEYYKENVFARPMTAEAMKGIEENVGKKMEGYKEANVTAYANSELELEEKAHECYRKFNEDAKLRRRDAQRLHLGKLQVNQMSYAMEHAKLGDTRFVNLNLAPKEFMDAALEKHKRRHLQWWQQHSRGRRMTRKEAVELSLQDVGDSEMKGKADDSESDALGELEKLLGYDFTPFDPMDALRAHQRPRITPQDLRLTAEQAQKLGVEQNSVLASSVSGPLPLGAGATVGAAAVGGNGNGVGDTNPAAEGGSATAAAASPAPAIVVNSTVAVGGAAVVSNTVTIAGAAPQPQPQTQSVVHAQGVISSSASSQTPPGGAAASVAAAGGPPVVNRAADVKPPVVASEMPGGEGVGVVAKTDSLLVSESHSRPESKEKGGSAGGGAGHADAAGEEKAYVRVEADISPGVTAPATGCPSLRDNQKVAFCVFAELALAEAECSEAADFSGGKAGAATDLCLEEGVYFLTLYVDGVDFVHDAETTSGCAGDGLLTSTSDFYQLEWRLPAARGSEGSSDADTVGKSAPFCPQRGGGLSSIHFLATADLERDVELTLVKVEGPPLRRPAASRMRLSDLLRGVGADDEDNDSSRSLSDALSRLEKDLNASMERYRGDHNFAAFGREAGAEAAVVNLVTPPPAAGSARGRAGNAPKSLCAAVTKEDESAAGSSFHEKQKDDKPSCSQDDITSLLDGRLRSSYVTLQQEGAANQATEVAEVAIFCAGQARWRRVDSGDVVFSGAAKFLFPQFDSQAQTVMDKLRSGSSSDQHLHDRDSQHHEYNHDAEGSALLDGLGSFEEGQCPSFIHTGGKNLHLFTEDMLGFERQGQAPDFGTPIAYAASPAFADRSLLDTLPVPRLLQQSLHHSPDPKGPPPTKMLTRLGQDDPAAPVGGGKEFRSEESRQMKERLPGGGATDRSGDEEKRRVDSSPATGGIKGATGRSLEGSTSMSTAREQIEHVLDLLAAAAEKVSSSEGDFAKHGRQLMRLQQEYTSLLRRSTNARLGAGGPRTPRQNDVISSSSLSGMRTAVYISKSHSVDVLGIDSPGPVYGLSGATPGPKFGFGTNKRAGLENPNSYPPTSNDLLHIEQPLPDKYKHKRAGNAKIGTSLRTAQVNAPGLDGYAPGMLSPGPAQYTANFGSANRMPPAFTMASKTKTGASKYDVRPGPQAYSLPAGLGAQPNARKPSLPRYSFGKAPRFKNKIEAVSLAEPGGDHDGTLRLKFQR